MSAEIPSKPKEEIEITNQQLLYKLTEMEKTICGLQLSLEKLKTAITGDVSNGDKIGLSERVRKIEDWVEGRKWYERAFISAVVVQLVLFIWLTAQVVLQHQIPQ